MTVNHAVTALTLITNGNSLTIQPAAGVEWIIHNIEFVGACEVYKTDGTHPIQIYAGTTSLLGFQFHLTNGIYFTVKNVSGGDFYISYDGIITVEP
jgi:hypothetical protein